jgi:hypothetical protein
MVLSYEVGIESGFRISCLHSLGRILAECEEDWLRYEGAVSGGA